MTKSRDLADNSQNTKPKVVDAKGDLIVGTGADTADRLAAGSNGYTLVADSSTSTGLAYSPTFFAGKNKIINGDFSIWQRGTSFTTQANYPGTYSSDRWTYGRDGSVSSLSVTREAFTAGSAPVAGYESQYYLRYVSSGWTGAPVWIQQRIEDVRTFAGQTVTLSFWAKAASGITYTPLLIQDFGSGGSSAVTLNANSSVTLTTSWARYSVTFTVPSISGKTIGTNNCLAIFPIIASASFTIDLWGVQVEAGSTATQFQTATGTIQGELAACQRYYQKSYAQGTAPATASQQAGLQCGTFSAAIAQSSPIRSITFPTVMRTSASVTIYGYAGGSGKVSDGSGADLAANSGSVEYAGDSGFFVYNNSGGNITPSSGQFIFHYVASAEL